MGVLDANGHQKLNIADAFGRITTVKEFTQTLSAVNFTLTPVYATTQHGYDTLDHLTRVTDTLTNTTVITYNTLGFKTAMLDPDMGAWSYTYDLAGNLQTQTDAKGQTLWFKYDELNRLTEKRQTNNTGPLLASFTYDTGPYGIGHRTVMSDTSGLTTWTYDQRGRTLNEAQTITSVGTYTTTYTYDSADRVRAITYPNGEVVGQTYNAASQLTSVCGGLDVTCSTNYASGLTYNALGMLKQLSLGNGATTTYDYYGEGGPATNSFRLWQIKTVNTSSTTLFNPQYTYDSVGNVKTITDTVNANQVQSFGYDALNRLISASTNAVGNGQYNESYAYNALGNITSKAGASYAYDNAAHKHAVTLAGSNSYVYDANGNMTSRIESGVAYTQTFDAENRLISVTSSISGTTSFVYNADGNRVLQILPNGDKVAYLGNLMEVSIPGVNPPGPTPTPTPSPTPTTTPTSLPSFPYKIYFPFLVGGDGQDIFPLPPTNPFPVPWGQTWKTYYYADSQLIAMRVTNNPSTSSDGVFYVTADHLDSVSLVMNSSGAVMVRQMYLPYGQVRYTSGTPPTGKNFTGQRLDGTGLLFYGARYYHGLLGRFISTDSVIPGAGNPEAFNRYSYVLNNPINRIDPTGHCSLGGHWMDDTSPGCTWSNSVHYACVTGWGCFDMNHARGFPLNGKRGQAGFWREFTQRADTGSGFDISLNHTNLGAGIDVRATYHVEALSKDIHLYENVAMGIYQDFARLMESQFYPTSSMDNYDLPSDYLGMVAAMRGITADDLLGGVGPVQYYSHHPEASFEVGPLAFSKAPMNTEFTPKPHENGYINKPWPESLQVDANTDTSVWQRTSYYSYDAFKFWATIETSSPMFNYMMHQTSMDYLRKAP